MEGRVFIGNNRSEDVKWLCSLSESELDMLISLKKLILRRAKVVRHESLAKKFDLKMLRALGFNLMQYVKVQLKDLQMTELNLSEEVIDGCSMLKLDEECSVLHMTTEDPMQYMDTEKEGWKSEGLSEVAPEPQREKLLMNSQG